MSATKFLRGECQHCGGHLEFPAEAAGTSAECPHCNQQTELFLSTGETTKSKAPVKAIVFIAIACLILIGGMIGAMIALKRAKRMAADRQTLQQAVTNAVVLPPNPFAAQKFSASAITLEKTPGSSLVRAVGTIKNLSPQRRFAVHVQIELKDDAGQTLAPATDYAASIEPNAEWHFKAMVLPKNATTARVTTISEDK